MTAISWAPADPVKAELDIRVSRRAFVLYYRPELCQMEFDFSDPAKVHMRTWGEGAVVAGLCECLPVQNKNYENAHTILNSEHLSFQQALRLGGCSFDWVEGFRLDQKLSNIATSMQYAISTWTTLNHTLMSFKRCSIKNLLITVHFWSHKNVCACLCLTVVSAKYLMKHRF